MRTSKAVRKTRETKVSVSVNIDGEGIISVNTGVKYLDHMITSLATHSMIDMKVSATGDLTHHIVEDVAICLGKTLKNALGALDRIIRFGYALVPMDDALAFASIDLARRPFSVVDLKIAKEGIEDTPQEDINHFFRSLASSLEANIHIIVQYGENDHHKVEAAFKALALSIRKAATIDPRRKGVPSSKGVL